MTAVASPPSLHPLPRLGWTSGNGGQGGLDAGEVSRMFTRKGPQRTDSSGSLSSAGSGASSTSTTTISSKDIKGRPLRRAGPELSSSGAQASLNGHINSDSLASATSIGRPPLAPPPATPQLLSGHQNEQQATDMNQPSPVVPSQKNMQAPSQQQQNGARTAPAPPNTSDPPALLVLLPINGTFERKQINVPLFPEILRIGRQTNAKTVPTPMNGYFDSKVLSRQHAEVWAERNGKIWIRDVKSSNGTFVNGQRLSPESRDSEPHELRENDVLELGIDIVSEDQKSIVHHKVSAKVEHAGIHQNAASVLDLNINDIDPGAGGGVIGPMYPQQIPIRGRGTSQGSVASNGRMGMQNVQTNMNGMAMPRHMNAWMAPVSIEQVVKRLANELKQAKQQSSDLHRTTDFFTAVLASEPGQVPPKPPASILPQPPHMNGITSPQKTSPLSPFAGPPAPPPRQPLPEKPDAPRSIHADNNLINAIKKSDADKAIAAAANSSPTKIDGSASQILSLAEALQATRRELEGQSNRVRALEESLKQERRARESAEERARHLLERSNVLPASEHSRQTEQASDDVQFGTTTSLGENSEVSDTASEAGSESSLDTVVTPQHDSLDDTEARTNAVTNSASELQHQLDLMRIEMQEMKLQMETYKHRADESNQRAEHAEQERSTLADMVEKLRAEQQHSAALNQNKHPSEPSTDAGSLFGSSSNGSAISSGLQRDSGHTGEDDGGANGAASETRKQMQQLQTAVVQALTTQQQQDNRLANSAPFASMLGVVLIGVGLMTYLNGWPKGAD